MASRAQHKQRARQVFIVKAGGPNNVTRSSPVIKLLDGIIDDYAMRSELLANIDDVRLEVIDGGGPGFKGPRTTNPYI